MIGERFTPPPWEVDDHDVDIEPFFASASFFSISCFQARKSSFVSSLFERSDFESPLLFDRALLGVRRIGRDREPPAGLNGMGGCCGTGSTPDRQDEPVAGRNGLRYSESG